MSSEPRTGMTVFARGPMPLPPPVREKKDRRPEGTSAWSFLEMGVGVGVRLWSGGAGLREVPLGAEADGEGSLGRGKRRGTVESWRRCCSRMRERWR